MTIGNDTVCARQHASPSLITDVDLELEAALCSPALRLHAVPLGFTFGSFAG